MPIVVTDACNDCRFTECVTVCPVACFHGDQKMLYIDPGMCIECRACIAACPIKAIKDADDLEESEADRWITLNAERAPVLPVISAKQTPLPGAQVRLDAMRAV